MKYVDVDGVGSTPVMRTAEAKKQARMRVIDLLSDKYDSEDPQEVGRYFEDREELLDILDGRGWIEYDSEDDFHVIRRETVTGFRIIISFPLDDKDALWNKGKRYWTQGNMGILLDEHADDLLAKYDSVRCYRPFRVKDFLDITYGWQHYEIWVDGYDGIAWESGPRPIMAKRYNPFLDDEIHEIRKNGDGLLMILRLSRERVRQLYWQKWPWPDNEPSDSEKAEIIEEKLIDEFGCEDDDEEE